MSFDFRYPNAPASSRGWGPGYPDCQTQKWVPLKAANGVGFGSVHRRVHDLLEKLVNECIQHGYPPKAGQCWGAVCRCSHRSDGTCAEVNGIEVPSNHSWGLAIDFNSLDNPFGGSSHKMPKWVVELFHDYGFRYLGPPINDWMHFDFAGEPEDADRMLAKAQANGIGKPNLKYKVGGKVFDKLRNALHYLHSKLRKAKPGDDLHIVVKQD